MFSIIKAGMASARNELSVISNNVANSNTTGFKKSISSYADLAPSSMSDSIQATSSGLGAIVDDTRLNHSQSTLLSTEKKTDLGLAGNGFFIIKKNVNVVKKQHKCSIKSTFLVCLHLIQLTNIIGQKVKKNLQNINYR